MVSMRKVSMNMVRIVKMVSMKMKMEVVDTSRANDGRKNEDDERDEGECYDRVILNIEKALRIRGPEEGDEGDEVEPEEGDEGDEVDEGWEDASDEREDPSVNHDDLG